MRWLRHKYSHMGMSELRRRFPLLRKGVLLTS